MTIPELLAIFLVGALLGAYIAFKYALHVVDKEVEREWEKRLKREQMTMKEENDA